MLGVSVDTLRRWSDAGTVHPITLPSGHRRFRLDEIEALVKDRTA